MFCFGEQPENLHLDNIPKPAQNKHKNLATVIFLNFGICSICSKLEVNTLKLKNRFYHVVINERVLTLIISSCTDPGRGTGQTTRIVNHFPRYLWDLKQ